MSWDLEQIYHRILEDSAGVTRAGGYCIVASGEALVNRQSATGKVYQGHLALGPLKGSRDIVWVGLCTYGPGNSPQSQQSVVYQGVSMAQACQAANQKVLSKIKRGYEPELGYPRLLDQRSIVEEISELFDGEMPQTSSTPSALEQLLGS